MTTLSKRNITGGKAADTCREIDIHIFFSCCSANIYPCFLVLQAGNAFQEAVYNETVQIVELEEGLDGETFFLYVFMAACVVLMLVVGQQFLYSLGRKRVGKKPVVETGTSNPNDVDYDWLPKETLNHINKKGE